jgi:hypothetical protein
MVGTNTFDPTDLAASIPEVWANMTLEQKFPEFVLTDFATDLSEMIVEGDIIHIPNIYTNTFTASTQATEGTEVTLQSPTQVDRTITVDTQKYVAFIIGDKTGAQIIKSLNLSEKYAKAAVKTLRRELEDSLFALYTSLTATPVGSAAAAIADQDYRGAVAYLEGIDNFEDRAMFMDVKVYFNQFLGLSKISPNYSSNLNGIETGLLGNSGKPMTNAKGMCYGVPVFTSTRVPAPAGVAKNVLLAKDAYGFGVKTRGVGIVRTQMQYKLENLGTLTVCDIIYGSGILRPEAGIVVNALNTVVTP